MTVGRKKSHQRNLASGLESPTQRGFGGIQKPRKQVAIAVSTSFPICILPSFRPFHRSLAAARLVDGLECLHFQCPDCTWSEIAFRVPARTSRIRSFCQSWPERGEATKPSCSPANLTCWSKGGKILTASRRVENSCDSRCRAGTFSLSAPSRPIDHLELRERLLLVGGRWAPARVSLSRLHSLLRQRACL